MTAAISGWLIGAIALCLQLPQRDRSTAPSAGSSTIAGVVVSAADGRTPVARASVTIRGLSSSLTVETDTDGRFIVADIPAGQYSIEASKPAWVTSYYGAERPWIRPGLALAVREREAVSVQVALVPGNVIEGRVLDANGQPYPDAFYVMALRRQSVGGIVRLVSPRSGASLTRTDDRGAYRLFGLEPGEYVVAAGATTANRRLLNVTSDADLRRLLAQGQPPSASPDFPFEQRMFAVTFFPGVSDPADATILDVSGGAERLGIDLVRRFDLAQRVSGRAVLPDAAPAVGARLTLMSVPVGSVQLSYEDITVGLLGPAFTATAVVDASGEFSFAGVPPGSYAIRAATASQAASAKGLWTDTRVMVTSGPIDGLSVVLSRGIRVAGAVVFAAAAGDAQPPAASSLSISLVRHTELGAWDRGTTARAGDDGRFEMIDLEPGSYRLAVVPSEKDRSTWFAKAAMVGGSNLLDETVNLTPGVDVASLRVEMTSRPARIEGDVVDDLGTAVTNLSVLLFSANRLHWPAVNRTTHVMRPDSRGRFSSPPLPPGDYYIAVLASPDAADLRDTAFLEEATRLSVHVTLADGERLSQHLVLKRER